MDPARQPFTARLRLNLTSPVGMKQTQGGQLRDNYPRFFALSVVRVTEKPVTRPRSTVKLIVPSRP